MLRFRWRLGALLTVVGGLLATAAAPCALACSCMPPQPLAQSLEADTAVVVGRVGAPVGGRYPFTVERWFTGPQPTAVLVLEGAEQVLGDGTVMVNTCGRSFRPGQHLVLVGSQQGERLHTSSCSLGAEVASPEGSRLIAEAEALFGSGLPVDPPDEVFPGPEEGHALLPLVLLGGFGIALVVLAGTAGILLIRARPPRS